MHVKVELTVRFLDFLVSWTQFIPLIVSCIHSQAYYKHAWSTNSGECCHGRFVYGNIPRCSLLLRQQAVRFESNIELLYRDLNRCIGTIYQWRPRSDGYAEIFENFYVKQSFDKSKLLNYLVDSCHINTVRGLNLWQIRILGLSLQFFKSHSCGFIFSQHQISTTTCGGCMRRGWWIWGTINGGCHGIYNHKTVILKVQIILYREINTLLLLCNFVLSFLYKLHCNQARDYIF